MNDLAFSYSQFLYPGEVDYTEAIERSIDAYTSALSVLQDSEVVNDWAETSHSLGLVYLKRILGSSKENQSTALQHFQDAFSSFKAPWQLSGYRDIASDLANLYADHQRWVEALEPYHTALQVAETLYSASLFRSSQEAELKETADLYRRAAYAHAKTGNLPRALELIEQGRARGLSETLQRDRANLDQIQQQNPELVERYRTAANTLRNLEAAERDPNPAPTNRDQLRDLATQSRADLNTCLTEIRQIPGYEAFLTLPTFADLTQSLPLSHPLLYLLVTPTGSAALLLHPSPLGKGAGGEGILWLDTLTEAKVQELADTWLEADQNNKLAYFAYHQNPTPDTEAALLQAQTTWHQTIDTTTRQLWDLAMGPITDRLQTQTITQATLIPTSYLSLLPLHAAWTPDPSTPTNRRYALDTCTYTYAPNARSLTQPQPIEPTAASLLAIDNPTNDLPSSSQEIATARSHFLHSHHLPHHNATRQATLAAIPHHTILHFSCHGTAELRDPLNSGLLMANDELLTLRDFFSLQLQKPRLAILSACETSLPGLDLPDEVISLPIGLLQAGVPAIIASLWSVSDLSTMLLLTRFYELWRTDNLPPAQALRQAQLWFRDTDTKTKKQHFQHLKTNPETQDLYTQLLRTDFSHPYHWSAFAYTGS